jgi:hypothetical protein
MHPYYKDKKHILSKNKYRIMVNSRVRALSSLSPMYHLNPPLDLISLHDFIFHGYTRSNFFSLGRCQFLYGLHFRSLCSLILHHQHTIGTLKVISYDDEKLTYLVSRLLQRK